MKTLSCLMFSMVIICSQRCTSHTQQFNDLRGNTLEYEKIGDIPVPGGYKRVAQEKNLFGDWLRTIRLKKDPRIFLFNGELRNNQSTHFAILDMPIGHKDLQQCADAIMRLRAEYFFSHDNFDSIHFKATDGTDLSFAKWMKGERYCLKGSKLVSYHSGISCTNTRQQLEQFLELVFSYCGTISLDKETRQETDFRNLKAGDIFIRAGSPGHAMIVVDVAVNSYGERVFMLAQGFMPAQSIHIVKNLLDETFSPWYRSTGVLRIITPDWIFYRNQLKGW